MNAKNVHGRWQAVVRAFAADLSTQQDQHGVKDLCRFLLDEQSWRDRNQVLDYLKDFLDVSGKHHAFHAKWSQLRNMSNTAEHDQHEMTKVRALIEAMERDV